MLINLIYTVLTSENATSWHKLTWRSALARPSFNNISLVTGIDGTVGTLHVGFTVRCYVDCCRLVDRVWSTESRIWKIGVVSFERRTLGLHFWLHDDFIEFWTARGIVLHTFAALVRTGIHRPWTGVRITAGKGRQFCAVITACITGLSLHILCPFLPNSQAARVTLDGSRRNGRRGKRTEIIIFVWWRWKHIVKNANSLRRVIRHFVCHDRRWRYYSDACITIQWSSLVITVTWR